MEELRFLLSETLFSVFLEKCGNRHPELLLQKGIHLEKFFAGKCSDSRCQGGLSAPHKTEERHTVLSSEFPDSRKVLPDFPLSRCRGSKHLHEAVGGSGQITENSARPSHFSHRHHDQFRLTVPVFPSSTGEHCVQNIFLCSRHNRHFHNLYRIRGKSVQNLLSFFDARRLLKIVVRGNHLASEMLHHRDTFLPGSASFLSSLHFEIDIIRHAALHCEKIQLKIALSKRKSASLSIRSDGENQFLLSDQLPDFLQEVGKRFTSVCKEVISQFNRIHIRKIAVCR